MLKVLISLKLGDRSNQSSAFTISAASDVDRVIECKNDKWRWVIGCIERHLLVDFGYKSQYPEIDSPVDLTDANKKVILNRAFVKIQSREYQHLRPDSSKIVFQEHL